MKIRIKDFNIAVVCNISCCDSSFALYINFKRLLFIRVDFQCKLLMCKIIVVTSSTTPSIVENSCSTPSIWIDVTAAPGSEDKRIRRKELPRVVPYPRSSGSTTNLPNLASSLISTVSILVFNLDHYLKPSFKTSKPRIESYEIPSEIPHCLVPYVLRQRVGAFVS